MKNKIYKFHGFELNPDKRQLSFRDEIVSIRSKPFEILSCLVENSGEIVEKQVLLDSVWGNSFVEENNLPVHISALRNLLKEKTARADLIKTISGRGYIFTAQVEEISAGDRHLSFDSTNRSNSTPALDPSFVSKTFPAQISPAASEAYIKGKYIIETVATRLQVEDDLYQAIEFFNLAIKAEPHFTEAYIGIGRAFHALVFLGFLTGSAASAKCKILLQQAYAINPNSSGVHFLEGVLYFFAELDIHRAVASFRKAIDLDETNAEAHYNLALCLLFLGQFDEALSFYRSAGNINPTNITYRNGLIRVYYFSGDFNQAIARAREVLEMDKRSFPALYLLSGCYAELGIYEEALKYIAETLKIIDTLEIKFKRAYILALMKKPEEAEKLIAEVLLDEEELKINLLSIVAIYAIQHKIDEAFKLLFKYYQRAGSDILSVKVDPRLRNLRNDRRFSLFLGKLKLV